MGKVIRKVTSAFYIDDVKLVEERTNGNYDIARWHDVDEDDLKRLHRALGEILTERAGQAEAAAKVEETVRERAARQAEIAESSTRG